MFMFIHTLYMLALVLRSKGTRGGFSLLIVKGDGGQCLLHSAVAEI